MKVLFSAVFISILVLFFGLALGTTSCIDTKKKNWINAIDQLIKETTNWYKEFVNPTKNEISDQYSLLFDIEIELKNTNIKDSLTIIEAEMLSKYKKAVSSVQVLKDNFNSVQKDLEKHLNSLLILREDISNQRGRVEKYDDYLAIERNNHKELRYYTSRYKEAVKLAFSINENDLQVMNNLILKLQSAEEYAN